MVRKNGDSGFVSRGASIDECADPLNAFSDRTRTSHQFTYQRYQKTNRPTYQLDFRAGYWYCLAYDCQKQAFRRYRCDAMQGLAPTEKQAIPCSS